MAIKIRSTQHDENFVKMLTFAKAGMGKTVLCSTAPNPLIISAESGLLSLADQDVPYIDISSYDDLSDAFEFVTESAEAKQYETICLDSLSEIAEVLLIQCKEEDKDPRKSYPKMSDLMATIIRQFRDLDERHVYFTAKQARITDEETGITTYQPMMPGKTLLQGINFFFDEVSVLRVGEDEEGDSYRYLQFQPDISYDCKDRSGKLGLVEKPDLTHIFNKIIGKKKGAKK